jgi:hypothetical protein
MSFSTPKVAWEQGWRKRFRTDRRKDNPEQKVSITRVVGEAIVLVGKAGSEGFGRGAVGMQFKNLE